MPLAVLPRFSRIAGAGQFFASGEGQRTALLLKIHGLVDVYRRARQTRLDELTSDPAVFDDRQRYDAWADYLPAIVFTYREIQTWRADAWSRDLIRTMLRTHTLALCGYSGADPIMHATFREVDEERAATLGPGAESTQEQAARAPASSSAWPRAASSTASRSCARRAPPSGTGPGSCSITRTSSSSNGRDFQRWTTISAWSCTA